MECDEIIKLLDELAQEFLFLDCQDIDIPTTGKLLNRLEDISNTAQKNKIPHLESCAGGLSLVLGKIILDDSGDKIKAVQLVENGIHLMQQIADSLKNTGKYDGNVQVFLEKLTVITGAAIPGTVPSSCIEPASLNMTEEKEESLQSQDESLIKDFITEGLEYIEEIEVNILNFENEPDNKDYINMISGRFIPLREWRVSLIWKKIRSLAHNLESLLDKARNREIDVSPALIDVVLDGADALKTLIGQLRDALEGRR